MLARVMTKHLVVKATTSSSVVAGPDGGIAGAGETSSGRDTLNGGNGNDYIWAVMKMTFSRAILVTTPSTVVLVATS